MSLGPCPECGSRISDQAVTCPRCGAPVASLVHAPSLSKPKRRYLRGWGYEVILAIVVVVSALAIYGRWRVRRNAPKDYKCWADLYEAQRETYLSLSASNRQNMNFVSCADSEAFLTSLSQYPAKDRDIIVYKAVVANHGTITPHE